MKAAHKGMGLTNLEHDAIVELLAKTLKEMGVNDSIIGEIAALVEPLRKDIVEK
jgi:truncated hemoglobin YjbI